MSQRHTSNEPLTETEKEIMSLICDEYTTPKIAKKLGLTVREVSSYRTSIKRKIHCRNAVGIVTYAIRTGIYKVW